MARWPYSLDLLPIAGITDPAATIELARGRLVNTLTILDGVLQMPSGLPGSLKQAIHNIRFHVISGIGLIDAALQLGHAYIEPASVVDGLKASIDNHIAALSMAMPIWNNWLQSERKQGFGNDIPAPIRSPLFHSVVQPASTGSYVGAGLATAGLYGLSRVPSMFHGMLDPPAAFHGDGGMLNLPPEISAGLQKVAAEEPAVLETTIAKAPPSNLGIIALVGLGLFLFTRKG